MTKQNIVIIKYNAGNIRSVNNALLRLEQEGEITADPEKIIKADKVIFPGVGEASTTMKHLNETGLADLIKTLTQPVLGICLGMQLMGSQSEEGDVNCLGIFDEKVKKFQLPDPNPQNLKIPQMGWNQITDLKSDLFDASLEGKYVYFVHSYYVALGNDTAATTNYIHPYSSALQRDNFFATQFHPEKSGPVGEKILKNFLKL
ncbi:imidazole glycerol phosphate synthase subunit HisH [Alkalitalea saponilacus]|uniref:Imidazole glycerol phosphate synthase subunit HisH n=1 Tax=Alkalitalea saponilacus TaxID=889453 RepID=A0A1T5HTT2_9BACT|nr:imidazole glycerol phosphate synthase subunit HisH [Alkalitalea saponilacus]ASB48493.1 imidazole glycerol phosphate synthase subunit HisH [Alkalitalea saponilacus]SKC24093.1 glutamine amidotransferase [Alkalitalea saponilacus]